MSELKPMLRHVLTKKVKSKKVREIYLFIRGKTKNFGYILRSLNYPEKRKISFAQLLKNSHKITYRGVTCRKFPTDYITLQVLIWKVKPDLIIEVGTNHGGSALLFSDLLRTSGQEYKIHTIDIHDYVTSEIVIQDSNIIRFLEGYENYNLSNCDGFNKIMVVDDGSHHYSDVIAVMRKFKDVVSLDSYLVIEDGGLDFVGWKKNYQGGPTRAIKEFLDTESSYMQDQEFEKFFGKNSTNNPHGYLKRIKI